MMKRLLKFPNLILLFLILLIWQVTAVNAATNPKIKNINNKLSNKTVAAATIDVWYGLNQTFGAIGTPQDMINILGNVVTTTTSLTYTLNSGPVHILTIGDDGLSSLLGISVPQSGLSEGELVSSDNAFTEDKWLSLLGVLAAPANKRLITDGDFNIEIFLNDVDLVEGANTVLITASDGSSSEQVSVTVNYSSSNTWPLPYTIDWSTVTNIQDVAQIVDGEWEIVAGQVKPTVFGYDRTLAIGDLDWDDYEVLVPVTIHDFPVINSGGVGIVARWEGHFQEGIEQPGTGWWRNGAYAYYRNRTSGTHYAFRRSKPLFDTVAETLTIDTTYNFKMRVQTDPSSDRGYFSFKVWEIGTLEPTTWIFEVLDDTTLNLDNGSALLVAHNADVSFGNVIITPILDVVVTDDGNGTAMVDPDLDELNPPPPYSDAYLYGDVITLTAQADTNFIFTGWTGDLSGLDSPISVTVTSDTNITATFAFKQELTITTIGAGGSVVADPPGQNGTEYGQGTVVTLTATPIAGWSFAGWSDNLSGTNPIETITMNTNKNVTATFTQDQYTLTTIVAGGGSISPNAGTYTYGEEVTLTATPTVDWQFTGWSGDLSGQVNPNTFMIFGDTTVTATFQKHTIYLPFIVNN